MVDSLSDMVLRGQAVQVHLEPLDRLESLMVEVQEWKQTAAATFLQKDSTLTLLEVKTYKYESLNMKRASSVLCTQLHPVRAPFWTLVC